MQDPQPENITGTKQVVHRVEHNIHWGYVAAGVGLLAVAFVLYRLLDLDGEDDESDMSSLT